MLRGGLPATRSSGLNCVCVWLDVSGGLRQTTRFVCEPLPKESNDIRSKYAVCMISAAKKAARPLEVVTYVQDAGAIHARSVRQPRAAQTRACP